MVSRRTFALSLPYDSRSPLPSPRPSATACTGCSFAALAISMSVFSIERDLPRGAPQIRPLRGRAAAAALHHREALGGRQVLDVGRRAVLDVVIENVDLPLNAVGVLHPELVLIGVTAVHAEFLADGQPGRLHALHLPDDGGPRRHLDAHVIDAAAALRGPGLREG